MTTTRQLQVFELISIHGCSQSEAGEMIDPPISQSTVNRDLKSLFSIHPELEAVKDYLQYNDSLNTNNDPSGMISYNEGMDGEVIAKF